MGLGEGKGKEGGRRERGNEGSRMGLGEGKGKEGRRRETEAVRACWSAAFNTTIRHPQNIITNFCSPHLVDLCR